MTIFKHGMQTEVKKLIDRLNDTDFKLPDDWFWWEGKTVFLNQIEKIDIEILHLLRVLHACGADKPETTKKIIALVKELNQTITSLKGQQDNTKQASEAELVNSLEKEITALLCQEFPEKKQNNGITSIITSMYNKKQETIDVVDLVFFKSLLKNPPGNPRLTEIIIIDDASPMRNETEKLMRRYLSQLSRIYGRVVFQRNPNNCGFSKSFNRGIGLAKGDLLMIANDDIYLTSGAIERLVRFIAINQQFGAAGPITRDKNIQSYQHCKQGPKIKSFDDSELDMIERFSSSLGNVFKNRIKEINSLGAFCFVTRRDVIEDVGIFDERFGLGYFEDTDLMYRINKKYKLGIMMDQYVHHGNTKAGSVSMRTRRIAQVSSVTRNAFRISRKHGFSFYLKHQIVGLWRVYGGRSVSSDYSEALRKKDS